VDDLVRGLIAVMESEAARGEVINLGNPDEHTVMEYAEIVRQLTGSNSHIVHREPAVGDDPQRRRPDIHKASTLLGWSPIVALEEGLSTTVDYFRQETRAVAELSA
jgi:nucleoside-diphosphate-sugar epimerase